MSNNKNKLLNTQDWPYIIKDLTLYSYSRFKFWNLLYEKGTKGYSPEDIALEAIELVITGEWNWDPGKSDLLPYLKFHVVKGLVANLARNSEVKESSAIDIIKLNNNIEHDNEALLNAQQIIEIVKSELVDNQPLLKMFMELYNGLTRKDICKSLNITTKEYDNQIRRLKTKLLVMDRKLIFSSLK